MAEVPPAPSAVGNPGNPARNNDSDQRRNKRTVSIWKMVLPTKRTILNPKEAGNAEIYSLALLCLARVFMMNRISLLVGGLDKVMITRKQSIFWVLWRESLVMALLSALHRQCYKYFENRLGAVWRKKITERLSKKYFEHHLYYTLGSAQQQQQEEQGQDRHNSASGSAGKKKVWHDPVDDPDERLVNDVRDVSLDMAFAACEAMYSATAGIFFATKLGSIYGLRYALAPYVYLISAFALSQKLVPVNWGRFRGAARNAESEYQHALERIETNHEAIRSLRGADNEKASVLGKFSTLISAIRRLDVLNVKSGFVDQVFFQWWLRTFVGAFVIGPHALRKDLGDGSLKALAELRGNLGHQFVLFVQSVVSAGVVAKMLRQLQKIAGSAGRVERLDAKLTQFTQEFTQASHAVTAADGATLEEGDAIAFEGVDVVTPTGVLLIKDLNFRLEYGESLLLTGANGKGKSSVFRCLGGLWKARRGKIFKPGGGEGLADDVFFLPQKPYCVIGNLSDQVQYPRVGSAPLAANELAELLRRVDLQHLLSRSVKDYEWDSILSLGEKQRLQIARLIYHKPKYCILDEVTSALPHSMERRLYALMAREGVSFISISHRPILRSFHTKVLTIGLDDAGYALENNPDHELQLLKESNVTSLLAYDEGAASTEQTQAVMRKTTAKRVGKSDSVSLWHKVRRLLQIGAPSGLKSKLALYIGGTLVQSHLLIQHTLASSAMMSCVFARQSRKERARSFLKLVLKGTLLSLAMSAVEQGVGKVQADIKVGLQQRLTKNLTERFMEQGRFFELMQDHDGVNDPAQRIGRDVPDLAAQLTGLLPLVKPLIEVSLLGSRVYSLVGARVSSLFFLYLACGSVLLKKLLPNFAGLINHEKEQEARYKLVHTRCKMHSEAIAFHGGDRHEKDIARRSFVEAAKATGRRLQSSMTFGIFNQAIIREAPMLVQWILRNEYSKRAFVSDADVAKDSGQKLNKDHLFLFNATNYTFEALGNLLGAVEKVATLAGVVRRVFDLDQSLLALSRADDSQTVQDHTGDIVVEGLDISTPTGDGEDAVLVRGVDLTVRRGQGLLVTGPTGSGKSAFAKILGGLWPKSPVAATLSTPASGIYLVPQKLYMCQGSLADQVTYPERLASNSREDARLQEVLDEVGIGYLSSRSAEGWDSVMPWEDCLSLGEQQRLSLARLFYHRSDFEFCILDDSTTAVSQEAEYQLYEIASSRYGLTCITISQRLALPEFHALQLDLLGDGSREYRLSSPTESEG
jgi:ATP-binding cassette, subfamily D (ALD), peroxisomal ABC transporter